jgi:hypothetical protein
LYFLWGWVLLAATPSTQLLLLLLLQFYTFFLS